ncbi:aspartate aminotransferase [Bimuria novae-zelandiae CBS 107.79]|uniref:Aspartate aminotransferase n=1 Tax=Bimuria novae-zelandiae CBS 107.79 TaxID=1447943 RepID=A0A6A5UGS1_9PLEO|nr:aspartate aminotransferase [Bimuria novae-zelandiae CBS 107.79]
MERGNTVQKAAKHPLADVPEGKLESLNALQAAFRLDARPGKADLMCGVYQTRGGKSYVLPSVKLAREKLFNDSNWEHEYPSSHLGEAEFRNTSARLLFGEQSSVLMENRLSSMQALGASGACHMGARFLKMHYGPYKSNPERKVYIPRETWVNHPNVFQDVRFDTAGLPYYNFVTHRFDFKQFDDALKQIPTQSIIVLQVCGNNPTGCDPSPDEWQQLAHTFKAMNHFAFLDLSYPGFATGNVADDCAPIRLFVDIDIPFLVAVTYGKCFGLYGERVGHLCMPMPTAESAVRADQQMKLLARAETGAQPRFGAKLVSITLGDSSLKKIWEEDLRGLAQDLMDRRKTLKSELLKHDTLRDWSFVTNQTGMFL